MSENGAVNEQVQLPFDMREVIAQLLMRKSGLDVPTSSQNLLSSYLSGRYQPRQQPSEGELFQMYAPEFLYIMENEPEGSWKKSAASSIAQGVPAYVVKDNLRQQLLTNPNTFGMSTSKEVDDFVDGLGGSYSRVQAKLVEQQTELDPFEKMGLPSASQQYSIEDLMGFAPERFMEIGSRVSSDSPVQLALAKLREDYAKAKAALPAEQTKVSSSTRVPPEQAQTKQQELYSAASAAAREMKPFSYGGKTYSGRQIIDELLPILKAEVDKEVSGNRSSAETRQVFEIGEKKEDKKIKNALISLKDSLKTLENSKNSYWDAYRSGKLSEEKYQMYLSAVQRTKADISALQSGKYTFEGSVGWNQYDKEPGYRIIPRGGGANQYFRESTAARERSAEVPSTSTERGVRRPGSSADGTAARPSERAMTDWEYKWLSEQMQRSKGGEIYAEQEAGALLDKIMGKVSQSGRSPLTDALYRSAMLNRGIGG
jgi:hypothetical protein